MQTRKLYDTDAYATEFDATVLSSTQKDGKFYIILDQTLFFPEEGGQKADGGTLDGHPVIDVTIKGDVITHVLSHPLSVGTTVHGSIFFDERFRKMQNHSGEHIVSGLIHRLFGLENVGFHLGTEDVTVDFSGVLTREQLDAVEDAANEIVYRNLPVTASYYSSTEARALSYRSKKDIDGDIRIVTVADVDVCACCAPHVRQTGEIGIIKLLDFIHYKGGVRIHMLCGRDALLDYRTKYREVSSSAALLSAKQHELTAGVSSLLEANTRLSYTLQAMKRTLAAAIAASLDNAPLCVYVHAERDTLLLREIALAAVEDTPRTAAVLAGTDEDGYAYVIASSSRPLRPHARELNALLNGRGGGNDVMLQGVFSSDISQIRKVLTTILA